MSCVRLSVRNAGRLSFCRVREDGGRHARGLSLLFLMDTLRLLAVLASEYGTSDKHSQCVITSGPSFAKLLHVSFVKSECKRFRGGPGGNGRCTKPNRNDHLEYYGFQHQHYFHLWPVVNSCQYCARVVGQFSSLPPH